MLTSSRSVFVSPSRTEWLFAGLASLLLIGGMVLLTNKLDLNFFPGDFLFYIDMAENGITDNPDLVAPFAYRPLTPVLARVLADLLGQPLETSFTLIAYGGAFLTLLGVYALARHFGARHVNALFIMGVIALTFYHLKYLLFDVYRPDHLAYGLLAFAMLALFRRHWLLCLLFSCIGLLTREFLIIPPILLILICLRSIIFPTREDRRTAGLWLIIIIILTGVAVMLPRLLIPVSETFVYATLFKENPTTLETITLPLFSLTRNLNLVFALVAYLLPVIWLGGWQALKLAWVQLAGYRWLLGVYTLLVLGLTLYGGTDLPRFVTYLVVPLVALLAKLLEQGVPVLLKIALVVALIIFNRILWQIPQHDYNVFLDYYGAYHDRVNINVIARWQELIALVFVGIGLRGGMAIMRHDKRKLN